MLWIQTMRVVVGEVSLVGLAEELTVSHGDGSTNPAVPIPLLFLMRTSPNLPPEYSLPSIFALALTSVLPDTNP